MRGALAAIVAIALACSCGRVSFDPLGGDAAGVDAQTDAPASCMQFGPFDTATPLVEINSIDDDADADLSVNGLTLWFASVRAGGGWKIFAASRSDLQAPFGSVTMLAELSSTVSDASPSVSGDGLTIAFGRYLTASSAQI